MPLGPTAPAAPPASSIVPVTSAAAQAQRLTHKRSGSGKFRHSPGPANIALSAEAGSHNNAMIAAAALADAASIPFPPRERQRSLEDLRSSADQGTSEALSLSQAIAQSTQPLTTPVVERNVAESSGAAPAGRVIAVLATREDSRRDETEVEDETEDERDLKDRASAASAVAVIPGISNASDLASVATPLIAPPVAIPATTRDPITPGQPPDIATFAVEANLSTDTSLSTTPKVAQDGDATATLQTASLLDVPPLSSYRVDPDSGIIGCICGLEEDDGFTIQCDVCFRWQHCLCMNFNSPDEVPDIYKCYFCDETKWGKLDADECRRNTLARLEHDVDEAPEPLGSKAELEGILSTSLGTATESTKTKRKHLGSERGDKRRKLESKHDAPKTPIVNSGTNLNVAASSGAEASVQAKAIPPDLCNELLEGGVTAELYQGTYYKLRQNDYKTHRVKLKFEEAAALDSQLFGGAIEVMTKAQFQLIKLSMVILPHHDAVNPRKTPANNTSIAVRLYQESFKPKFTGHTKLGLFIKATEPNGSIPAETPIIEFMGEWGLFDDYKEDKTNQYGLLWVPKPRVLKVELPTGAAESPLTVVSDARFVGNESRFIRTACPANSNCYIKPVFISDNKTFRLLVVTSKQISFIEGQSDEELRLDWQWDPRHPILKMLELAKADSEALETSVLTGVQSMPATTGDGGPGAFRFDQITESEKAILIASIDCILTFAECACGTAEVPHSQCAIFKTKKAVASMLRSSRKSVRVGTLGLSKSKETLILNRTPRTYVPWPERHAQRDRLIINNLIGRSDDAAGSAENVALNNDGSHASTDGAALVTTEVRSTESAQVRKLQPPEPSRTLTYRQQLVAKSRKLKELHLNVDSEVGGLLTVPVMPELIIRIENEISKRIAIPKADIVGANLEMSPAEQKVAQEPTRVSTSAESFSGAATSLPPKSMVKKLSFADYKKKMK